MNFQNRIRNDKTLKYKRTKYIYILLNCQKKKKREAIMMISNVNFAECAAHLTRLVMLEITWRWMARDAPRVMTISRLRDFVTSVSVVFYACCPGRSDSSRGAVGRCGWQKGLIKMAPTRVILMSCGSYNPPTNMHLRMFGM